jgi:glycosyltransferase involved in cell wall biosynthesis
LHGSAPGSLGAIAARVARRPAVPVIFSSYELHPTMPLAERFARRVAARLPAVTVAPSTAVAEALLVASVPRDRLRLVQLGTAVVAPLPPPEDEGVVRFVYVANFWPWKAHDVVLRAVSDLPARLDWELVLVGDGAERSAAEALARDAGIAHRVRFLGTLDDPWSAAAGSWAYVHPSRREALPLAILEAMMRGLPVVAAAAGGVPDVVRPGHTGILVPPGDVVALAAALRQLGESRSTRDALAGSARSFALERLRLDTWLDSLFSLYEGLIT